MTPWSLQETYELLPIIEQIKKPARYLRDIFFKEHVQTYSDVLALEYTKSHRRLAPYIVEGARGLNMSRDKSQVKLYNAPLIGARRTLTPADISQRIMGEQPIYSSLTPADRALELQTRDLVDLTNMLMNRQEKMCAELLTTGAVQIRAFADDGALVDVQTVTFDEDYVTEPDVAWNDPTADIYGDIKATCDFIAEEADALPDVMICGVD